MSSRSLVLEDARASSLLLPPSRYPWLALPVTMIAALRAHEYIAASFVFCCAAARSQNTRKKRATFFFFSSRVGRILISNPYGRDIGGRGRVINVRGLNLITRPQPSLSLGVRTAGEQSRSKLPSRSDDDAFLRGLLASMGADEFNASTLDCLRKISLGKFRSARRSPRSTQHRFSATPLTTLRRPNPPSRWRAA